jgi:hypothetical protein
MTPEQAGMRLQITPYAPKAAFWLLVAVGGYRADWHAYLGDAISRR